MTDEENNGENGGGEGTPTPDAPDMEALVGKALEDRGLTAERISILDSLGGLGDRIESLFAESGGGEKGASFDEEGFLSKVGALFDEKTAGLSGGSVKKDPPLRRWLKGSS